MTGMDLNGSIPGLLYLVMPLDWRHAEIYHKQHKDQINKKMRLSCFPIIPLQLLIFLIIADKNNASGFDSSFQKQSFLTLYHVFNKI